MLQLNRILCPVDFTEEAQQVLQHALFLAREHGAVLHVLHGMRNLLHDYREVYEQYEAGARARLQQLLEAQETGGVEVRQAVVWGDGEAAVILDYAGQQAVDLIVMGTRGRRGVKRMALGSVAEEVVRKAECPVLVLREVETPFPASPLRRILVPLDLSEHGREALAYARGLAAGYGARIELLHVLEASPPAEVYGLEGSLADYTSEEVEARAREEIGRMAEAVGGAEAAFTVHLEEGRPARCILDFAEAHGVDLIVLSSRGRTGLKRFFLGSVAEEVVRTAPCPVFVVKL